MQQRQEVSREQRRIEKHALSPAVSQLAEISRLGRFTTRYTFTNYTAYGCMSALFLFLLSGLLVSASVLLAAYAIVTGVAILLLSLLVFGVIPLLMLAYIIGKKGLNVGNGDSATAYFYQQGLVYLHKEEYIVLRWEQIERVDILYGPVRRCQIALADGGSILLINGVRAGLSQEIRRRLMRYRKKHQHHEEPDE